ncbi:Oidioi.mRNA.OKI2018_I69.PAR.g12636.t1.cds [Oikopleura dioica]|uniref:Oidioi.mRNA.OKI2018_I69.PAR.g12636.t1.cds n=1 Tax=Oikopleura dioica TaxID=34765 RepID=A0ABN7S8J0_OIKDI|nr:Oidioi.mRNA.OKI2018_I69.PAR.g12636.t1.cds [Oikopleura dioica]
MRVLPFVFAFCRADESTAAPDRNDTTTAPETVELKAAYRNHVVQIDSNAPQSTFSNPKTNVAILSKNLFKLSDERIGLSLFNQIGDWQKQTGYFEHPSADHDLKVKYKAVGKSLALNAMIEQAGFQDSGKLKYYGCYCLPSELYHKDFQWHDTIGKGKPVDAIDRVCQKLINCYKCIHKTYHDCPSQSPYSLHGACSENDTGCGRDLCECDTDFAKEIAEVEDTWNEEYTQRGGFDRSTQCAPHHEDSHPDAMDLIRAGQKETSPRPAVGAKEPVVKNCCGKGLQVNLFNPERQECCKDGSTKAIGTCPL